jgi:four helix bundle protein
MSTTEIRESMAESSEGESRREPAGASTAPQGWQPGLFEHERLDVFKVARQALVEGEKMARRLPRGYAVLADQLRRALLSAYLGVAEAASRAGADRLARFRCARGEASEAAAAVAAVVDLGLSPPAQAQSLLTLLGRQCAMLTRLARPAR